MSTELATMNWRNYVGRFSVEFEVANPGNDGGCKKSRNVTFFWL